MEETTSFVGFRALGRVWPRWVFDVGLRCGRRPEARSFADPSQDPVDYRLNTTHWHTRAAYRTTGGLTVDLTVEGHYGREPNGKLDPSYRPLEIDLYRMKLDAGWIPGPNFGFTVGAALDLQPRDERRSNFGGAQGRFFVYW